LRPYFAALKADPAFHTLAMPLRFRALCDVIAIEHPERANWMRRWSPAAKEGTLKWLETATKSAITKLDTIARALLRMLP
jgi:hypothetical protein